MSTNFQPSLPSSHASTSRIDPSPSTHYPNASALASFSVPLAAQPTYTVTNGTWKVPANWALPTAHGTPIPSKKIPAPKRTPEEEEIVKETAARFASQLASDHTAVLNPSTDAFVDVDDVVKRLLPYHVYYQPRADLDRKGKGKAEDEMKSEIKETKFALECFKRKRKLEERYRQIRTRQGKRPAPDDQAVFLEQAVLEADRTESAMLNAELRGVRLHLDKIERERRSQNARVQAATQYYRTYPYAYAQQYAQAASGTAAVPQPGASASTVSQPVTLPSAPATQPIPVQLPVALLPSLQTLGIQPVPASSLSNGTAQATAVLTGSSPDGTVLNLEINIGLLQPTQIDGLRFILSSLLPAAAAGQAGAG